MPGLLRPGFASSDERPSNSSASHMPKPPAQDDEIEDDDFSDVDEHSEVRNPQALKMADLQKHSNN